MVILRVCVADPDGDGDCGDVFLAECRCADPTSRVLQLVAELYSVRLRLRAMLALHADPPAEVAHALSAAAVRAKQLLALEGLARHADRLALELAAQGVDAPPAPPPDGVCSALLFARRELPRDETPLSAFCGTTNEKSQLTLTMVPGAQGRAPPLDAALRALGEGAPAQEVSLLAFVSCQAEGGGRGREPAEPAAGAGAADDGDDERPKLTSEHIERLWASRKVCSALRSAALQQTLRRIDQSANAERELDRALLDAHFAEFVNDMLVEAGIREPEAAGRRQACVE